MRKIVFVLLVLLNIPVLLAKNDVVVEIKKGVMKPVSIAFNICNEDCIHNDDLLTVVKNDLEGTALFRSVPQKAFMQKLSHLSEAPVYLLWKTINSQYLLNIDIKVTGNDLIASAVLYDISSEMKVSTFFASGSLADWRKIAHLIANNVYARVTGERGYFDTKILYVSVNKKSHSQKVHRLAIMDQDGYGHKYLTNGNSIVLTPRFSPIGDEFSFFAYREKIVNGRRIPILASIYRFDLKTERASLLARFKGMTYAPRYSPDGNLLIFSLSNHGSSSIYTYDLLTKDMRRITRGSCIDTSPCYSPDGRYIVFNSDRGGSQQLYIMDADGSNIRRLSFSSGRYATPVWSPRGDWIAFTKFGRNGFYIGVIRPDGTAERMIASSYLVEGPTWSPNGRVIMFSHQDYNKKEKIFSVDITGYNKHEILTPNNAIDPEWSKK